jgi:hypothetical protein
MTWMIKVRLMAAVIAAGLLIARDGVTARVAGEAVEISALVDDPPPIDPGG